jgi:Tfp pilus assembly protein PilF
MRRLSCALLALLMLISVTACGGKAQATYQEQYDLGVKYLSEGNYEQAVIAFTAAIQIDPKQAPAYTGRGDAYVQLAASDAETAGEKYENAAATSNRPSNWTAATRMPT